MMVSCLFTHITCQLCYFDFILEFSLETCVQHFPLSWFQSIDRRWNRSNIVSMRIKNEFLVDEIRYGKVFDGVIGVRALGERILLWALARVQQFLCLQIHRRGYLKSALCETRNRWAPSKLQQACSNNEKALRLEEVLPELNWFRVCKTSYFSPVGGVPVSQSQYGCGAERSA